MRVILYLIEVSQKREEQPKIKAYQVSRNLIRKNNQVNRGTIFAE